MIAKLISEIGGQVFSSDSVAKVCEIGWQYLCIHGSNERARSSLLCG